MKAAKKILNVRKTVSLSIFEETGEIWGHDAGKETD